LFFARNTANEEPREKKKQEAKRERTIARCMRNFYVTKYVPAHISQLTTHARAQDDYYHIIRSNKSMHGYIREDIH
jgi:hypothetical protein